MDISSVILAGAKAVLCTGFGIHIAQRIHKIYKSLQPSPQKVGKRKSNSKFSSGRVEKCRRNVKTTSKFLSWRCSNAEIEEFAVQKSIEHKGTLDLVEDKIQVHNLEQVNVDSYDDEDEMEDQDNENVLEVEINEEIQNQEVDVCDDRLYEADVKERHEDQVALDEIESSIKGNGEESYEDINEVDSIAVAQEDQENGLYSLNEMENQINLKVLSKLKLRINEEEVEVENDVVDDHEAKDVCKYLVTLILEDVTDGIAIDSNDDGSQEKSKVYSHDVSNEDQENGEDGTDGMKDKDDFEVLELNQEMVNKIDVLNDEVVDHEAINIEEKSELKGDVEPVTQIAVQDKIEDSVNGNIIDIENDSTEELSSQDIRVECQYEVTNSEEIDVGKINKMENKKQDVNLHSDEHDNELELISMNEGKVSTILEKKESMIANESNLEKKESNIANESNLEQALIKRYLGSQYKRGKVNLVNRAIPSISVLAGKKIVEDPEKELIKQQNEHIFENEHTSEKELPKQQNEYISEKVLVEKHLGCHYKETEVCLNKLDIPGVSLTTGNEIVDLRKWNWDRNQGLLPSLNNDGNPNKVILELDPHSSCTIEDIEKKHSENDGKNPSDNNNHIFTSILPKHKSKFSSGKVEKYRRTVKSSKLPELIKNMKVSKKSVDHENEDVNTTTVPNYTPPNLRTRIKKIREANPLPSLFDEDKKEIKNSLDDGKRPSDNKIKVCSVKISKLPKKIISSKLTVPKKTNEKKVQKKPKKKINLKPKKGINETIDVENDTKIKRILPKRMVKKSS